MPNPCERCRQNCCQNFCITTERFNRQEYHQTLLKFPFIHQIDEVPTIINGYKCWIHVHSCDRFNLETGECRNYDTQPRPNFCLRAGIIGNRPNPNCLLNPSSNLS